MKIAKIIEEILIMDSEDFKYFTHDENIYFVPQILFVGATYYRPEKLDIKCFEDTIYNKLDLNCTRNDIIFSYKDDGIYINSRYSPKDLPITSILCGKMTIKHVKYITQYIVWKAMKQFFRHHSVLVKNHFSISSIYDIWSHVIHDYEIGTKCMAELESGIENTNNVDAFIDSKINDLYSILCTTHFKKIMNLELYTFLQRSKFFNSYSSIEKNVILKINSAHVQYLYSIRTNIAPIDDITNRITKPIVDDIRSIYDNNKNDINVLIEFIQKIFDMTVADFEIGIDSMGILYITYERPIQI